MSEKNRPGGRGRFGGSMPMGRAVEKPRNFRETLKRLMYYLKPENKRFMAVFFLAIFSTVFNVVGPKVLGKATTKLAEGIVAQAAAMAKIYTAIEQQRPQSVIDSLRKAPVAMFDMKTVGFYLGLMLALYIVSALFSYAMGYIMSGVSQNTVFRMRADVKAKLDRLPLKYFDQRTHGEILSRITNDMEMIGSSLQQSLTQLITAIVTLIGIIVMMLSISPLMTLIALITLPVSMIFTAFIAKKSQKYFAQQQKSLGQLNGHVEEMYSGHKIVKVFGKEKDSLNLFGKINEDLYKVGWKAQFMSGIILPALGFVSNIGYVMVCIIGGIMVAQNKIDIGDIQAFIQYMRQFSQPIVRVANITNVLQSTVAAAERVFEVMNEEEQEPDTVLEDLQQNIKGAVSVEKVMFGYTEEDPLMKGLSVEVAAGDMVAIVGPTGAGKTTLVNLLMRFYEIQGGTIKLDGIDIRNMSRSQLRRIFGMVLQDTWLFKGTIRENIAYGKEGSSEEEIMMAAKAAHAHHFIKTLPEGYDTVLNEEASNISQGQKQLLTIARAILADPVILILDEATSNVDTRTEVLIQKAMANLMKDRTSFVIAHRLSTIRDARTILVMNQGDIIEQGNHDQLLAAEGFYADLYNSQWRVVDEPAV